MPRVLPVPSVAHRVDHSEAMHGVDHSESYVYENVHVHVYVYVYICVY